MSPDETVKVRKNLRLQKESRGKTVQVPTREVIIGPEGQLSGSVGLNLTREQEPDKRIPMIARYLDVLAQPK